MMTLSKANNQTFQEEVLEVTEPVLVDFYADWCGPCHLMTPVLHELGEELSGQAKVVKVDVDESSELASHYEVRSIPSLVLIKNGEVKVRLVGAHSKEALLDAIRPHLN